MAPLEALPSWSALDWTAQVRAVRTTDDIPSDLPFPGGLVGWFGYEAGAWMDRMAAPAPAPTIDGVPFALPVAWFGRARAAIVQDHREGRTHLVGEREAVAALAGLVAGVGSAPPPDAPTARRIYETPGGHYEDGVRAVLGHLRAGDCYQVNLARRLDFTQAGDAFDLWRRLRRLNPARRGMLVETPHGAVVSNSPELLLSVRRERPRPGAPVLGSPRWITRSTPIKGTASARGEPAVRRAAAAALLASAKERAELTMIVDLVRADLGHVAAPGTVVAGPRRVGAMGHVWHAAQRVDAVLAEGKDAADAFRVVFPAGSVTGAPRLRAMDVIRRLEEGPRGVYCGAVGWFGVDGSARFNVAIRTITVIGGHASFHVGAGLVLGSVPAREYQETVLKAERLALALEAH